MDRLLFPFWNRDERRLRAGWRLVIQFIAFVLVAVIAQFLVVATFGNGTALGKALMAVLYLAFELGAGWLVARFIDRRRFADFGYHVNRRWWLDLAFGFLVGGLMISGIFVVEWLAGWVTVTAPAPSKSGIRLPIAVLIEFLFFVAVACNEEFISRGYQIRNLAEGLVGRRIGPRAAIAAAWFITAALFGLAHAINPGATVISSINIMLTAGGLLGLAYVATGELAIPIGIHLAWNFFQGPVYGFAVSGTSSDASLFNLTQGGPKLWTGGEFGPEAGLLCTISCAIALALVAVWIRGRQGKLAFDAELARYTPRFRREQTGIAEQEALSRVTNGSESRVGALAAKLSREALCTDVGPPA
jgi:membrane protease YdiL (CAAX protease family)